MGENQHFTIFIVTASLFLGLGLWIDASMKNKPHNNYIKTESAEENSNFEEKTSNYNSYEMNNSDLQARIERKRDRIREIEDQLEKERMELQTLESKFNNSNVMSPSSTMPMSNHDSNFMPADMNNMSSMPESSMNMNQYQSNYSEINYDKPKRKTKSKLEIDRENSRERFKSLQEQLSEYNSSGTSQTPLEFNRQYNEKKQAQMIMPAP